MVCRLDIPAEVSTVDFGLAAFAADVDAPHLGRHRLTHLVRQDKAGFVLHAEITAHRQHALALHLIAEDRNREKVGAQRQLVERKQRSAGDREILTAGFAAPARRTVRATAGIDNRAAAVRAVGVPVVVCPAEMDEYPLGFLIDVSGMESCYGYRREGTRVGRANQTIY